MSGSARRPPQPRPACSMPKPAHAANRCKWPHPTGRGSRRGCSLPETPTAQQCSRHWRHPRRHAGSRALSVAGRLHGVAAGFARPRNKRRRCDFVWHPRGRRREPLVGSAFRSRIPADLRPRRIDGRRHPHSVAGHRAPLSRDRRGVPFLHVRRYCRLSPAARLRPAGTIRLARSAARHSVRPPPLRLRSVARLPALRHSQDAHAGSLHPRNRGREHPGR